MIYRKECDKNCGTSVTRARDHLLGIVGGLGGGVKRCEKIKPEVRESLREEIESHKNINDSHAGKNKKVQDALMGQEVISTPSRTTMTSPTSHMPYGSQREPVLPDIDARQQMLKQAWNPLERKELDNSIYDFFIGCNISFNTIRSHLFKDMIKKIAKFGPTYDPPSYNILRTKGVERSKARMEERVKYVRDS